jgi:hypothetical protein
MPWIKFARTHDDYSFAKLKHELAHPMATPSSSRLSTTTLSPGRPCHPPIPPGSIHPVAASMDSSRKLDVDNDLSNVENVTNTRLWLPSDVPPLVRSVVAGPELIKAELELLVAELHDCLVGIRKYQCALMITRRAY